MMQWTRSVTMAANRPSAKGTRYSEPSGWRTVSWSLEATPNRKLATRAMALTEASVVKMRIMTGCYGREETDGPKAVRRCYFSFHTHQARLSVPYERVEGDRYTQ